MSARFAGGRLCGALRYAIRGAPVEHASTPLVLRGFCGACGSSLTHRAEHEPDTLDVSVASLDDPEALPLEDHICTADGLAWMQVDDARPHFRQRRQDG